MADISQTSAPQENHTDKFLIYIKTLKGIIQIVEIVLCLTIIICYAVSWYQTFIIVTMFEMIFSIIIFIVLALDLQKTFMFINFPLTDLIHSVICCLIFFIISLISLVSWWSDSASVTGGVFGLLAALAYGYNASITFTDIKNKRAQHGLPASGIIFI